jgi:hypothetical protein
LESLLGATVDQRSFIFGAVGFRGLQETFGRRVGEGGRTGEGGGIGQHLIPVVEFVAERKLLLHVGEGRKHDLAEVGKDGGFAKGDTVLRDGSKELAEDVIYVGGGEEIPIEGDGNLVAKALGLEELQFLPGMEGTEGRMDRAAQHAAAAAVGKWKLATRGDNRDGSIPLDQGLLIKTDKNNIAQSPVLSPRKSVITSQSVRFLKRIGPTV